VHQREQANAAKIQRIAEVEQDMADQDAADNTPKPVSKMDVSQLHCTKSYLKISVATEDLEDMDIDGTYQACRSSEGDDSGFLTETDVEKPPKKKKRVQEGLRANVNAACKMIMSGKVGRDGETDSQHPVPQKYSGSQKGGDGHRDKGVAQVDIAKKNRTHWPDAGTRQAGNNRPKLGRHVRSLLISIQC